MAKVFRLHSGKDTIVDWQNSSVYGSDAISKIVDPNGGTASKEITSIPSPFARIDIVKNAFKIVSDTKNLDGDTIYNKAVSDSLDVGEIFFNIDKLRDKVQIIVWDLENDLDALLKSKNDAHRTLGETIDMYMKQDATAYNFDKLKRIYLLNYIGPGKTHQMNIIGATSPCTLFFSSANNLQFVANNIHLVKKKLLIFNFKLYINVI